MTVSQSTFRLLNDRYARQVQHVVGDLHADAASRFDVWLSADALGRLLHALQGGVPPAQALDFVRLHVDRSLEQRQLQQQTPPALPHPAYDALAWAASVINTQPKEKRMRSLPVLLDIDGMLCDFIGGALAAHGRPRADRCRVDRWEVWEWLGLSEADFWGPLGGEDFWAGLEPTAECQQILGHVERFAGGAHNVTLLSSPMNTPACHAGKYRWIMRCLPQYQHRYALAPDKAAFAAAGVLIDDCDKNVDRWREAGGWAVLLPRPWNSRRDLSARPIEALASDLRRLDCLLAFHDS